MELSRNQVSGFMGMGGKVGSAPACYGGSLSSNSDIPQKSYMGDISKRSGQYTLARKKSIQKSIWNRVGHVS
jgi:hypothetical protein